MPVSDEAKKLDSPPVGRRIQIGWMQIEYKGMPFNQSFTIPHQLTLKQTPDGVRMFAQPVEEVESLRMNEHTLPAKPLIVGHPATLPVSGELFDVEAKFELGDTRTVGLDIGCNRIAYDAVKQEWLSAPTKPTNGQVTVRVLLDRSQIEV